MQASFHFSGLLTYPDGKEYKGRFTHGNIEGFGEMKVPQAVPSVSSPLVSSVFFAETPSLTPDAEQFHLYRGRWENGKLNGLASIT